MRRCTSSATQERQPWHRLVEMAKSIRGNDQQQTRPKTQNEKFVVPSASADPCRTYILHATNS